MRVRWVILPMILAISATSLFADQDRATEPSKQAQVEAEKLVKEVYKEDFAKRGPVERRALAEKLLSEGRNTKSDPNTEYVLLSEARDMAIQVADIPTAMDAIKELDSAFVVDAVDMKLKALISLRGSSHTVEANTAGAEAALTMIDEALATEKFDAAVKASELAVTFATGAHNIQMTAQAQARKNDIKAQSMAYLDMQLAADKLKTDPKDNAASYAVGIYQALYNNVWDKGLPLIANGNEPTWAAAAKADLANPVDLTAMLKVADGWWDLAQQPRNSAGKSHILSRAEFWYKIIVPNSDGIIRSKVEKRLDQIASGKITNTGGIISEATRKLLPTQTELQNLRDACIAVKNGNNAMVNNLFQMYQQLCSRLSTDSDAINESDYIARCKANLVLRQTLDNNGCASYTNNFSPFWNNYRNYLRNSKTKEEFAARIVAIERFNLKEMVIPAPSFDSEVYMCIRNFVQMNRGVFITRDTKEQFCDYLATKGLHSTGLDRYRTYVSRLSH